MASPYMIAQYAIFWVFPSAAERTAHVPEPNERYKLAYQRSDKSLWILDSVDPLIWADIGSSTPIEPLGKVPAYGADGGYSPISLTSGDLIPAYNAAGSAIPISLVDTNKIPLYLTDGTQNNLSLV